MREFGAGGHSEGITTMQLSLDGMRLATGGHDCVCVVWDTNTASNLGLLDLHTLTITSVAWLDSDPSATAMTAHQQRHTRRLKTKASSKKTRVLATASMDRSIRLWEEKITTHGGAIGTSDMRCVVLLPWLAAWVLYSSLGLWGWTGMSLFG